MPEGVTITPAGADRIDVLTDFWLRLHAFQGAASVPVPGVPLREDSDTGPLTRALYLEWLSQPDSFAFFAEEGGGPVGFIHRLRPRAQRGVGHRADWTHRQLPRPS
ncbi:MAG TPA: hypothetical protein VFS38_03935 [Actinomycetota bacterium]|nr:hypothetical protein [Actinomycetota bacterium]